MSAAFGSPVISHADWCLRFVERRCGSFIWAPLRDEGKQDVADGAAGTSVLSLAEVDLAAEVQEAADHEYLAVLALRIREEPDRLILRFVTPSMMRSAGRAYGSRRLFTDIMVPTPAGLDAVSLLLYRVRRTLHVERVLAAVENAVEMLEIAGDNDNLVLGRAALERLEVLDGAEEAEIVLSGCDLRFRDPITPADERFVAVVAANPVTAHSDRLWLTERKLLEGQDRASATPIQGKPYLLLRFGRQLSRESVREFIDEIRRRYQRRPGEAIGVDEGESFSNIVGRQADRRRQELIEVMFGHQTMLPVVTPIALEVAANLSAIVALTDNPPSPFKQFLDSMRGAIEESCGIRIPGLRVRINDTDMPLGSYLFMLDEVPLVMGTCDLKMLFCLADQQTLASGSFEAEWADHLEAATMPDGSGRAACWIPVEHGPAVRLAGFETWDAAAYVGAHLRAVVLANLAMFATLDEIERLLSAADQSGQLFGRIEGTRGRLPRFVETVRSLLMEGLSIAPIGPLAQGYLANAEYPTADVAEELRRAPAVQAQLIRDVSDWHLFLLAESYEATIRANIHREGDAAVLALEPEITQEMLTAVRNELGSLADGKQHVLVVEDWRLRSFVRSLLLLEFPQVRVVARREIEGAAGLPAPTSTITVEP
jgi:hypothetical protein